jgi:hypothetical protein
MLKNHNFEQNPFCFVENRQNILKRERGSAPNLEVFMWKGENMQKGVFMDEGYSHNHMSKSLKRNPFGNTINSRQMEQKTRPIQHHRIYYSQSPSPVRLIDVGNPVQNFNGSGMKHSQQKISKLREGGKMKKIQRRAIKVGTNNKKFPKDFFN